MQDLCEHCEYQSSDCYKDTPKCGKDVIWCEKCNKAWDWDKLPDEQVKVVYESRGEFWGAPCSEPVCYGWYCDCGYYNEV
jgi:hypothetical protein